eukprot:GHRR01037098.1.p2 GENE.GHRR01037098.1~~GHRR01037098.1.p2  ORF type:complete len:104 (-),score=40.98 GHRR01037098.1:27-338(-)
MLRLLATPLMYACCCFKPLQGYPRGFPVLLPNKLFQARSASALQYLIDGNYLDKKSKRMAAELLTFNADLQVLGYTQLIFDWKKDGAIQGGLGADRACLMSMH